MQHHRRWSDRFQGHQWQLLSQHDSAAALHVLQVAGKFIKNSQPCKAAPAADDEQLAAQLWRISQQLTQQQAGSAAA